MDVPLKNRINLGKVEEISMGHGLLVDFSATANPNVFVALFRNFDRFLQATSFLGVFK